MTCGVRYACSPISVAVVINFGSDRICDLTYEQVISVNLKKVKDFPQKRRGVTVSSIYALDVSGVVFISCGYMLNLLGTTLIPD